jgi:hypothetical protein
MVIIYNRFIPFKGFVAINLFGVIFYRKDAEVRSHVINHEMIHTAQMMELLFIGFYLAYFVEWLYHLIQYRNNDWAYHSISFEKEAMEHEYDFLYLTDRKHYSQWRKEYEKK